jgi:hypothetical protein
MGDFVEKTVTKTAVRELASPIEDVTSFNAIVQNVITNNPFSCVPYMQTGVNHQGVEKTKEEYVARVVYENTNAKTLGEIVIHAPTATAFDEIAAIILGNATIATKMGGIAHRDVEKEGYSATLKCHDPNGELYNVVFSRDNVRLNSYSDDAIRTKVETWADGVPALA